MKNTTNRFFENFFNFLLCALFFLPGCSGDNTEGVPSLTGMEIFSAGKFVYVFNPPWGILSRVDSESKSVLNITLGKDPVDAKVTPDGKSVVVLNRGSQNLYIIDTETNSIQVKSTGKNLDSLALSPASDFAVAFHIYKETETADFEGVLKLNEYSIINLKTPDDDTRNVTLGGGAPQGVTFSPDGKRVLIISRNRCFVLDPEEPQNYSSIELWPDPSNIIIPAQIEITPDGRFAFIRTQNTDYLYVIDMDQVRVIDVIEGNKPTFFGVFPDGSRALMVNSGNNTIFLLRLDYNSGRVYKTDINAGLAIDSAQISAFDACNTIYYECINPAVPHMIYQAILYSITGADKKILYLYLDEPSGVISKVVYGYLPAPVQSVGITPFLPLKILVTHRGISRKPYPISIIDLFEENVNTIYLDAMPTSLILTEPINGSLYAFMTLRDSNKIAYYEFLSDNLDYKDISAVPVSAGLMQDNLYILHDQPLGTITFLNLNNFETTEVKGVVVNGLLDR